MKPLACFLLPLGLVLGPAGHALRAASGSETPAAAEPASDLVAAWREASLGLHQAAQTRFAEDDSREGRLGRAALLLLRHPKTEGNIDTSCAELETLAQASPPDDVAVAARYLLGRVAQIHRQPADLKLAAEHFRRLLREAPEHPLADQALIKLALIELFEPSANNANRRATHERYAVAARALGRPESRRDLSLVLAESARRHGLGDERVLAHYVDADATGIERPVLRSDVTVAIARLAERTGQGALARRYYERFLAEFQRDNRRAFVADRLAALPPAAPAIAAP